jgi:4-diphosphocytidyl-2C-methyl-D-erythritol kinase
VEGEAVRDL